MTATLFVGVVTRVLVGEKDEDIRRGVESEDDAHEIERISLLFIYLHALALRSTLSHRPRRPVGQPADPAGESGEVGDFLLAPYRLTPLFCDP
jgi:hypothetical protein